MSRPCMGWRVSLFYWSVAKAFEALNPEKMTFNVMSMDFNSIEIEMKIEEDEDIKSNPKVGLTALSASGLVAKMCDEQILNNPSQWNEEAEFCNGVKNEIEAGDKSKSKKKKKNKNKRRNKNKNGKRNVCPGGTLKVCINACPSDPIEAFIECNKTCGSRCK